MMEKAKDYNYISERILTKLYDWLHKSCNNNKDSKQLVIQVETIIQASQLIYHALIYDEKHLIDGFSAYYNKSDKGEDLNITVTLKKK